MVTGEKWRFGREEHICVLEAFEGFGMQAELWPEAYE
jgi:hypothetical protein